MADIFISYAREDRKAFAEPLATALKGRGLDVWFDVFKLKAADSIRASIDRGLAKAKLGVVILSKSFFKKYWTQLELGGLFAASCARGCRIVPVWLGVDFKYVASKSPMLADIKPIVVSKGVAQVAKELEELIRHPSPPPPAGVSDCISVQADAIVHGIDKIFIQYTRLLLRDGKNPDLIVNIHRDALVKALPEIPDVVYKAINDTFDFHKLLKDFNNRKRLGKKDQALFVSMSKVEGKIEQRERHIRQGLLELLTRDAIKRWIAWEQDVADSMCAYIKLFFSTHSGKCHLDFEIIGEPQWGIHMHLNENEADELYRRANNSLIGTYDNFHHEQIVGKLIPEILYRTIPNRQKHDPKPIPDYVFDLEKWNWFATDADDCWKRIKGRNTKRGSSRVPGPNR